VFQDHYGAATGAIGRSVHFAEGSFVIVFVEVVVVVIGVILCMIPYVRVVAVGLIVSVVVLVATIYFFICC